MCPTQQGNEAGGVLWLALVAHHFLIWQVEGAVAAAGTAAVAGQLGGAVGGAMGRAAPAQTEAPPEADLGERRSGKGGGKVDLQELVGSKRLEVMKLQEVE